MIMIRFRFRFRFRVKRRDQGHERNIGFGAYPTTHEVGDLGAFSVTRTMKLETRKVAR